MVTVCSLRFQWHTSWFCGKVQIVVIHMGTYAYCKEGLDVVILLGSVG